MGLFSKTQTTTDSGSQLLVADTPDLVKDSILISIINNRSIADDLLDNYLRGLSVRALSMYNYGKNTYTYGLPNGTLRYAPVNDAVVQLVIEQETSSAILIFFNVITICDPTYYAYEFMQNNRDWDSDSDLVTPPFEVDYDVYFDRAETEGIDLVRIYYKSYSSTSGAWFESGTEDIVTVDMVPEELYYHVGYYLLDNLGNAIGDLLYWNYRVESGTNPTLDLADDYVEQSPYYPIVPLRQNAVDLTADTSTELYKTSKHCLNLIGVDIDSLAEGLNANPDIDDVDHSYVMIGINIQSLVQNSIVYLHDYFSYLGTISHTTLSDYSYWEANNIENVPPTNTVEITDAKYRMELTYNYITTELITGSIGEIGFATRTNIIVGSSWYSWYSYNNSSIVFRKQVTDTQYEQTTVKGLVHLNYAYVNYIVYTTLEDSLNSEGDKNNFIIPLNIFVAKNMGIMNHNYLMYDAIRIVYSTKVTTKLKWYQTGFFQFVALVIAIVITVWSLGTLSAAVNAAYIAGGALAAASFIVQTVAIGFVLGKASGYVVDQLGIVASLVVTLVLLAVSRNFSTINIPLLPNSVNLMSLTSVMFNAIDTNIAGQIAGISEDLDTLQAEQEALQLLQDELDGDLTVDPLDLIAPAVTITHYESPEVFYNRTIHQGNIGVLSLDAIEDYVDGRLRLEMPTSPIRTII